MIRKLRCKFVSILMGIVTLILLSVFVAVLLSTWGNANNMSINVLRQALSMGTAPQSFQPSGWEGQAPEPLPPARERLPILLAEIGGQGEVTILINQLYFLDEEEAGAIISQAMGRGERQGMISENTLRFLKSEDGLRLAMTDASMEQAILKKLLIHSLLIGSGALILFFFISLALSRWAVRPVERAWQRQKQFVADASHDLKTPLTVILSNADILKSQASPADEKKARRIEHIQAEALRMKKLVEDLLTLAKTDSIESRTLHGSLDFSFIVTNAILTYEPILYDEQKKLEYDVREGLFVKGDAQLLRRLADVLLDNARKYCPAGGEIRISLNESERRAVLLTVTSQGETIPKEELEQIFLRFYRIDKSRSVNGGYGLGLSIAKSIVKKHGGKIWAESGIDRGNSFFVSLPQGQ